MSRKMLAVLAMMLTVAMSGSAWAALCPKCRDLMFVDSEGKCKNCSVATTSGALVLCPKCSAQLHKCEHCQATVDAADVAATTTSPSESAPVEKLKTEAVPTENPAVEKPAAEKPAVEKPAAEKTPLDNPFDDKEPATLPDADPPPTEPLPIENLPAAKLPAAPLPIDTSKSGAYSSGKWQYRLEVTDPGTRGAGQWGWLWYDGKKLPRGQVNDYYRTPWGTIFWVEVPKTRAGLHGWVTKPMGARQGKALAPPVATAAAQPAVGAGQPAAGAAKPATGTGQPASTPAVAPNARPGSLELTKADSGKRAKVFVGNVIVVRLPGNPTTGYSWQVAGTPNPALRLVGQPQYTPKPTTAGMVGVGGTYVFLFRAVAPGTTSIRLAYQRAWDKAKKPADTFALGVDVVAAKPAAPAKAAAGSPTGPKTPARRGTR